MEFLEAEDRYYLEDPSGKLLAEVNFQPIDGGKAYVISHTFVDTSLRGQGIAGQLVKKVVDKARAEHKTIEPLCTFARHEFDTKPDYADVLRKAPNAGK